MQSEAATDFPLIINEAEISRALVDAATADGADLVVLGRGKAQRFCGRFQTHLLGIIRHAPCPVISYSLNWRDSTSLPCDEEHRGQFAERARVLTSC